MRCLCEGQYYAGKISALWNATYHWGMRLEISWMDAKAVTCPASIGNRHHLLVMESETASALLPRSYVGRLADSLDGHRCCGDRWRYLLRSDSATVIALKPRSFVNQLANKCMCKPKAELVPLFGKYDSGFIAVIFLGCRGVTREKADNFFGARASPWCG